MLSRTEAVWRHLLVGAFDRGIRRSSLTQLSAELDLPVSTIHKALERPRAIGAVRGSASGLRVLDPKRLQLLWAALRDLNGDIVYATKVPMTVNEIEARLPISAIPTAYTAFVQHEGRNLVADYEQVIVYAEANEVRRRFPFAPSVAAVWLLLPGVVTLSVGRVLSSYLLGRNRQQVDLVASLAGLVVTLALDLVLIPRYGFPGAAAASSVAYTATLGVNLTWVIRNSTLSARDLLVPRPSDFLSVLSLWPR